MTLLCGTALENWQRYKALDLALQQTTDPAERARLERALHEASLHFRRAVVEQRIRLRALTLSARQSA